MLFLADAGPAVTRLKAWIDAAPEPRRKARAELVLSRLFRARSCACTVRTAHALHLKSLDAAHFTYVRVSPADDVHHEGSYTPTLAMTPKAHGIPFSRPSSTGPAKRPISSSRASRKPHSPRPPTRFRELAHSKAERDAEFAPWQPDQIISMEMHHAGPIRTPDDLMRVILSVLADIQRDLTHEDASLRKLVLSR